MAQRPRFYRPQTRFARSSSQPGPRPAHSDFSIGLPVEDRKANLVVTDELVYQGLPEAPEEESDFDRDIRHAFTDLGRRGGFADTDIQVRA